MDLLPDEFDVAIVGTGLCESILAAALSLSGSSVLHLDENSFYGSSWATISASHIEQLANSTNEPPSNNDASHRIHQALLNNSSSSTETVNFGNVSTYHNLFPHGVHVFDNSNASLDKSRLFIDLTPRPIMASAPLIDILARTNAGHYIDFRPIQVQYQQFSNGDFQKVPASRADIFQSKFITPIEKRLLTRFITACMQEEGDNGGQEETQMQEQNGIDDNKTFDDFLDSFKLSDKLKQFVATSIAFVPKGVETSAQLGRQRIHDYAKSMLRFGTKTPFLFANYGTGEFPQAFCRLSAVRGGTYILRRSISNIIVRNEDDCDAATEDTATKRYGVVTTNGDYLQCNHVFMSHASLLSATDGEEVQSGKIWRLAAVLDRNVQLNSTMTANESDVGDDQARDERMMIHAIERTDGDNNKNVDVRIRIIDSSTQICPPGNYVMYAECLDENGREDLLINAVKQLVNFNTGENDVEDNDDGPQLNGKPNVLWAVMYARDNNHRHRDESNRQQSKVEIVSPDCEVEHDVNSIVKEAERCFHIAAPNSTFFPDVSEDIAEVSNGAEDS